VVEQSCGNTQQRSGGRFDINDDNRSVGLDYLSVLVREYVAWALVRHHARGYTSLLSMRRSRSAITRMICNEKFGVC